MAKAYLRLENEDGSFREFKKEKIKAYWVKEGMKHSKKIRELEKNGDSIGLLEERLKFTCDFFGDKDLTPDTLLSGLQSDELISTLDYIFDALMGNGKSGSELGKQ